MFNILEALKYLLSCEEEAIGSSEEREDPMLLLLVVDDLNFSSVVFAKSLTSDGRISGCNCSSSCQVFPCLILNTVCESRYFGDTRYGKR